MWGDSWGPMWTVNYAGTQNVPGYQSSWSIEAELEYHLGAVYIYACWSGNPNCTSWNLLSSSPNSFLWGRLEEDTPDFSYAPASWGMEECGTYSIIGGKQATNEFVYDYL